MNLICCNYDCKHQKEGYCYLSDTSKASHTGSSACIFFEPNEEDFAYASQIFEKHQAKLQEMDCEYCDLN